MAMKAWPVAYTLVKPSMEMPEQSLGGGKGSDRRRRCPLSGCEVLKVRTYIPAALG